MYHLDTSVDMERTAKMRIEDKISKLMCQTGACSLVLGILSVIGGLVLGIIGIVNGARLLRHHSDLMYIISEIIANVSRLPVSAAVVPFFQAGGVA